MSLNSIRINSLTHSSPGGKQQNIYHILFTTLIFCGILLSHVSAQAQAPQWQWAVQSLGSGTTQVKHVATDATGNTYVVGFFTEETRFGATVLHSQGRSDLFVAKLSATGHWEWATATGGTQSDRATGVAVDAQGHIFVVGSFSGEASFGPTILSSRGGTDLFVGQLNAEGTWLWARAAGGDGFDSGCGLVLGSTGGVLVAGQFSQTAAFGTTTLTSQGSTDAVVARLSDTGEWQWATAAGSADNDEASALATTATGDIYVTGYFSQSGRFGATVLKGQGMDDAFVGKLSGGGQWLWATAATGTNTAYGKGLVADPTTGGVFVTGSYSGEATFGATNLRSDGSDDGFVARLTAGGQWEWVRVLASSYLDHIAGVALDHTGKLYVAGTFSGTVQGGAFGLTSRGHQDAFIGCLDRAGAWLGLTAAGGPNVDEAYSLALTPEGEVCIGGIFNTAAAFGPVALRSGTPAAQAYVGKARVALQP